MRDNSWTEIELVVRRIASRRARAITCSSAVSGTLGPFPRLNLIPMAYFVSLGVAFASGVAGASVGAGASGAGASGATVS